MMVYKSTRLQKINNIFDQLHVEEVCEGGGKESASILPHFGFDFNFFSLSNCSATAKSFVKIMASPAGQRNPTAAPAVTDAEVEGRPPVEALAAALAAAAAAEVVRTDARAAGRAEHEVEAATMMPPPQQPLVPPAVAAPRQPPSAPMVNLLDLTLFSDVKHRLEAMGAVR